jgi:hypothetical protein
MNHNFSVYLYISGLVLVVLSGLAPFFYLFLVVFINGVVLVGASTFFSAVREAGDDIFLVAEDEENN